jgi:membrane protein YdbS with pleckstrin-like domain
MDAPQRPLSSVARTIWRLQQIGIWGALTIGGLILAGQLDALGPLPWIVPLVGLVVATALIPRWRWSRWRWDVRDEGIDIQHGTLTVRRTLVPWVRVQHVDTRRGVFEQSFGLSTVVVHTAAGGHTIPLLPASEAESLRERIAGLARTDDDEELEDGAPAAAPPMPADTAPPATAPPAPADPHPTSPRDV